MFLVKTTDDGLRFVFQQQNFVNHRHGALDLQLGQRQADGVGNLLGMAGLPAQITPRQMMADQGACACASRAATAGISNAPGHPHDADRFCAAPSSIPARAALTIAST